MAITARSYHGNVRFPPFAVARGAKGVNFGSPLAVGLHSTHCGHSQFRRDNDPAFGFGRSKEAEAAAIRFDGRKVDDLSVNKFTYRGCQAFDGQSKVTKPSRRPDRKRSNVGQIARDSIQGLLARNGNNETLAVDPNSVVLRIHVPLLRRPRRFGYVRFPPISAIPG